jgi:hypothetical protein
VKDESLIGSIKKYFLTFKVVKESEEEEDHRYDD